MKYLKTFEDKSYQEKLELVDHAYDLFQKNQYDKLIEFINNSDIDLSDAGFYIPKRVIERITWHIKNRKTSYYRHMGLVKVFKTIINHPTIKNKKFELYESVENDQMMLDGSLDFLIQFDQNFKNIYNLKNKYDLI
jgi:hypothetical protein